MVCLGRLPLRKFPFYALAQYLGAFLASAFLYMVYSDALDNFDGGDREVEGPKGTAGIWATYPQTFVSTGNGLGDQVFATTLLMIAVLAITDKYNSQPASGLAPFLVGYTVVGIAMAFGLNAAFAINPARDLGPRIFTACAGWGSEPFTFRNHNWFWVPIVGPHLGALIGALVYELFVGVHWPNRHSDSESYDIADDSRDGQTGSRSPSNYKMEQVSSQHPPRNDRSVHL